MPRSVGAPVRLGAFTAGLVAVFIAAFGAGRLAGPIGPPPAAQHHDMATGDFRLAPLVHALHDGADLRFRVEGPGGEPVTRYETVHDKELHLIVVRRDLSGFQHLHPTRDASGVWSTAVRVPGAGPYRAFADFTPAGRANNLVLGADLEAPGDYRPTPLPAVSRTATVEGGYTVTLDGDLRAGTASALALHIARDGAPVTDLDPYLGAYGHLVALREGDLAYLHVHPETGPAGPVVRFTAEVPETGRYRLYLDFQHGGTVHTAEFTAEAR